MANRFNLVHDGHPVMALNPAADSAGRSGVWIDMMNAHKVYVMVDVTQGSGTGVPITFSQALTAAGGSAKALSANLNIWANQAAASTDTFTPQTAATSFTTSATQANQKIVFEVIPESALDVNKGFRFLQVVTGASGAGNITAASYFVLPSRYAQQQPPSALS
jgi:C4-dicarboxylate transporter